MSPFSRLSIQPLGGRLTFRWDAVDQRRSMVDLSGGRTTYVYNAIGNLTRLTNPQGNRTTNTYDAAGQRTQTDLANRTWVTMLYDAAGRVTRIKQLALPLLWPPLTVDQWAAMSTAEWSALDLNSPVETSGLRYKYDKANRRTSRLDESGNRVTWTYDNAGQLASETQTGPTPLASVWTYDAAGNRDTQTKSGVLTSYTRDAADRVTAASNPSGTTTYKYDAAGNQTEIEVPSGAITTTTWDFESRQRAVEQPDGTAITFTYNCDDWRVQREDTIDTVYYQYDKNNLLAELDGAVVQVQYTNEPNEFGNVISQYRPADGEAYYYVFDALGSTVALTDNVSGKSDDYTYDAWGDVVAQTGATINPMQYVGQLGYYRDEDIERTHVRRREYSDLLGRFFSQDPLRQAGGDNNLYRYVQNDPVNSTDPSGLEEPKGSMFQQFSTKACHAPPSQQFCGPLSLSGFGTPPKPVGQMPQAENAVGVQDGVLQAQFDPTVRLSKATVDALVKAGVATIVPDMIGTRPREVVVINFPTNGVVRKLLYRRLDDSTTYSGAGGPSAPVWRFRDTYQFVGDGPSDPTPETVVDCKIFSPENQAATDNAIFYMDIAVRVTPFLGTADRVNAMLCGQDQANAENITDFVLSAAGDVLIIGGIVCRVAAVGNEARVLTVLAYSEAALAGANTAVSVQHAISDDPKNATINGAAAALNLLVLAGAIRMIRVRAKSKIVIPDFDPTKPPPVFPTPDNLPPGTMPPLSNNGFGMPYGTPSPSALASQQLRKLAEEDFISRIIMGHGKGRTGPAVSVARDKLTGKISQVYYNDPDGKLPQDLSNEIAPYIGSVPYYPQSYGAGSHSDIYAVNELLKARPGAKLCEIQLLTLEIESRKKLLTIKPACAHCSHLLQGVEYLK